MIADAAQPNVPAPTLTVPAGVRRVILLGFMGAGKTTVGRLLAERLGWRFVDLDHHLESRAGATVAEIFAAHGEDHFRRLESSALANALGGQETVLSLGGGTPEQLTNRLLLEQTPGTHIVYLAAPFPVLYDRCMLQSIESPAQQRPLLTTPEEAEARYMRRHPVYRRLARHTVETEGLDAAGVARAVLRELR